MAPISQVLSILEPILRTRAQLSSWQLISPLQTESLVGRVIRTASIASLGASKFEQPTVLVIDDLGGEEDLPEVEPSTRLIQDVC